MNKELLLVKESYCIKNNLPQSTVLDLVGQGRTADGDFIFTVQGPTVPIQRYVQERISLTSYSLYTGLMLDTEYKNKPAYLTKEVIGAWFTRKIGHVLLPEDIGQLLVTSEKVSVVSSANSMRFKHSFFMRFK